MLFVIISSLDHCTNKLRFSILFQCSILIPSSKVRVWSTHLNWRTDFYTSEIMIYTRADQSDLLLLCENYAQSKNLDHITCSLDEPMNRKFGTKTSGTHTSLKLDVIVRKWWPPTYSLSLTAGDYPCKRKVLQNRINRYWISDTESRGTDWDTAEWLIMNPKTMFLPCEGYTRQERISINFHPTATDEGA